MLVSEILRIKGNTLFTTAPEGAVLDAVKVMADHDIGSLVVMDHGRLIGMLTFREVLAALLRIEGHNVHLAKNGAEALKIASERNLDVLILDVAMPGMSDYEVARHLRANGLVSQSTRLIALTGWTRAADRSDALEAGFNHHLKKPVDVEALKKLLSAQSS